MLTEIQISNFAIIENQSIYFTPGFNVLTGQTGSGKSIILDALSLILGERASTNSIRTGASNLEVHALFDLSNVNEKVKNQLPDIAKVDDLAISRVVTANGRSKVYINGNLNTVSVLNQISQSLISICSQSEQISLLNPKYHLDLLDGYSANQELLNRYKLKFFQYKELQKQISDLTLEEKNKQAKIIWLEETINQIQEVSLYSGLRSELEAVISKVNNHQKILSLLDNLEQLFTSDQGLLFQLSRLPVFLKELEKLGVNHAELDETARLMVEAGFEFDKKFKKVALYYTTLDGECSLEEAQLKLSKLSRLERKHATNEVGLIEILNQSKNELAQLLDSEKTIHILNSKLNALKIELEDLADQLSNQRNKMAKNISKEVEKELAQLNMSQTKFLIKFTTTELNSSGKDSVEFFIQPNKGFEPRPLKQIASGGELSRVLLVLKKILRDQSNVNILVFDEVDTGISGAVATAVGQKLKSLSKNSQVICITHLPQVASFADHHLLVEKLFDNKPGVAKTVVRALDQKERVDEIARMLSGFNITDVSRASANELLKQAV